LRYLLLYCEKNWSTAPLSPVLTCKTMTYAAHSRRLQQYFVPKSTSPGASPEASPSPELTPQINSASPWGGGVGLNYGSRVGKFSSSLFGYVYASHACMLLSALFRATEPAHASEYVLSVLCGHVVWCCGRRVICCEWCVVDMQDLLLEQQWVLLY